jgi:hypothetical protein
MKKYRKNIDEEETIIRLKKSVLSKQSELPQVSIVKNISEILIN